MSLEQELELDLEDLIRESVRKAVSRAGQFAVALSGGSDSGLMAALTHTQDAITVRLPYGEMYDEFEDALSTVTALGIRNHHIVQPRHEEFAETMRIAVPLIGRATRHFSVFPLYKLFARLARYGFDSVIFGDGPDESMCGYVRCILMDHIYNAPQEVETFYHYRPLFEKALPPPFEVYARALDRDPAEVQPLMEGVTLIRGMCQVEMALTRADVGGICDIFGEHFGIQIIRPYMDPEVDQFMFNIPDALKIHQHWGKYLQRRVASRYVPDNVVWRRRKMGGPVYPVNVLQGWMDKGEFDKGRYLAYQNEILQSE